MVRLFEIIVSVMVKQFSRGEGKVGHQPRGKVKFFKEVEIFREGFKLFLVRWNWDFLTRGFLEVTLRELKNFQRGLRIFGEIKKISSVGVEAFHDG